mmetsp:Transcript_36652/g.76913  ORF Transcript_36652/g.76913 Transcript_36652/m.76913 type:complete len:93 (+) Transcript_36652:103-381(+)
MSPNNISHELGLQCSLCVFVFLPDKNERGEMQKKLNPPPELPSRSDFPVEEADAGLPIADNGASAAPLFVEDWIDVLSRSALGRIERFGSWS